MSHLERLFELLAIPSISARPEHRADLLRAAQWLAQRLAELGFASRVDPTEGHPIVFAHRSGAPGAPRVLIYGHYDVQPPDPLELWRHPPFEPTLEGGRIYARGASDDKGQLYAHIAAIEELGQPSPELIFLIEGEEEISSPHLRGYLEAHREELAHDVLIISDGAMWAPGVPALTYGLRGLVYLEAEVQGAQSDLHSGVFGGAAPNPLQEMARLIALLKDERGKILIPGFYDRVRPLNPEERAQLQSLEVDPQAFARSIGASALPGEEGFGLLERLWARPTLDVHGIWGGYQGEGAKTVIPARGGFKFSMRLVPDQEPLEIAEQTEAYLKERLAPGYQLRLQRHGFGRPVLLNPKTQVFQKAVQALESAWGRAPVLTREGGSIPVVADFQELFQSQILLMGLGLPDDQLHAPNEKFELVNFEKGIQASRALLKSLLV